MKWFKDLSLGTKFGLVWMCWFGLLLGSCVLGVGAVERVTGQARAIYSARLRPSELLAIASNSLTSLGDVLASPVWTESGKRPDTGSLEVLKHKVEDSMSRYRASFSESRKRVYLDFQTAEARQRAGALIRRTDSRLDDWDDKWTKARDLIQSGSQPRRPANVARSVQEAFAAAGQSLGEISSLNDQLGNVQVDDAQDVSYRAESAEIIASVLAFLSVLLVGAMHQWVVVNPLMVLTEAADRVRGGDLKRRIQINTGDEMGVLATTFNSMMGALEDAHQRLTDQNVALQDHARALEALAEAEAAQRRAETEASRLKSEFLANMSHELRTPMNSVIGYGQVLLEGMDGPLTADQRQDIERILASGHHLLELINSVLDLSKIESGMMTLELERLRLADIVRSALQIVQPMASQKDLEVRVSVPDDLPLAYADAGKTRQVLLNLLANAVKFTPRGHVEVAARFIDGMIEIAVNDTGIGVPEAAREHIFEEFRQADGSTSRRFGGTGLGLAISRKLIRLQHGDITLESTEGVGSSFRATLPVAPPLDVEIDERAGWNRANGANVPTRPIALSIDGDVSAEPAVPPRSGAGSSRSGSPRSHYEDHHG